MHAQKYFEYVPWRGRMSEFWDSKWLAWDITRSEYKLAGGSKAGLLGYGNRLDNSKENLVAATFPFLGQPPGVWSVCLGEKGALEGKEEDSGLVKLQKMDQLYDNNNVAHIDLPTNADFAGCTGVTKRGTAYNKGTFCNGGYKLDASGNPVAKGEAGCSAFDGATANLFYCEGACDVNCPAVTPAQIAEDRGKGNTVSIYLKHCPGLYCIDFDTHELDGCALHDYLRGLDTARTQTRKGSHHYLYITGVPSGLNLTGSRQQKVCADERFDVDLRRPVRAPSS